MNKYSKHDTVRSSPDVFVLTYIEAVKVVEVGFVLLFALWLGEPFYHLRFQLHGDVAWQHRQEELLLLPRTQRGQVGDEVRNNVDWLAGFLSYRGDSLLTKASEETGSHQKPL